jgi:hypothetical protein
MYALSLISKRGYFPPCLQSPPSLGLKVGWWWEKKRKEKKTQNTPKKS